jgi:methylene-tetrahydromethanopterin dehydrogenase
MDKPSILHMFTPTANLSPFDVNMAIDAGWQHCIPYTGLDLADITGLTQDAIFSRGPKGVKRTGIFLGGRDIHTAMQMLEEARQSMVPPFEISVFADPSGAFTTAAGMVASVAQQLLTAFDTTLQGQRAYVFGGTGPVGSACALLVASTGAETYIVSHEGLSKAEAAADVCHTKYGRSVQAADGSSAHAIKKILGQADVVFSAAKAGVQVLGANQLAFAEPLKIACDVNAVSPEGIAGVDLFANGQPIANSPNGALGIGALAVGNLKYQVQQALLRYMHESDIPVYLHFDHALEVALAQTCV